ncbi:MAG: phage tail protein [Flavobacteriaceae bacterium]|nr:phage tail protein [Flavobacteriaceae bacterium]
MEPFIGQIIAFGGNFAPRGWAFCDGQLLSISQNTALFSILGTIYGGDGRTTFALPDLRGRAPMHEGTGPGLPSVKLGTRAGTATKTLTVLNMPSHNHMLSPQATAAISVNEDDGDSTEPKGRNFGLVDGSSKLYNSEATTEAMASGNIGGISGITNNVGGGQSFDAHQPYLAINYIIAMQGTFPSRN